MSLIAMAMDELIQNALTYSVFDISWTAEVGTVGGFSSRAEKLALRALWNYPLWISALLSKLPRA